MLKQAMSNLLNAPNNNWGEEKRLKAHQVSPSLWVIYAWGEIRLTFAASLKWRVWRPVKVSCGLEEKIFGGKRALVINSFHKHWGSSIWGSQQMDCGRYENIMGCNHTSGATEAHFWFPPDGHGRGRRLNVPFSFCPDCLSGLQCTVQDTLHCVFIS